jgi:hypothetical protein
MYLAIDALTSTVSSDLNPETKPAGAKSKHKFTKEAVLESFKHAWNGYTTYAYGADELRPLSNQPFNDYHLHITLIDSLSTLALMNMNKEIDEAEAYLATNFALPDVYSSLFEVNIRVLGGLVSAYDLTGRETFLNLAVQLGDSMLGAFDNELGVPYTYYNLKRRKGYFKMKYGHITSYGPIY